MISLTRITTEHESYKEVEKLMNNSFPIEERRDNIEQRQLADNKPEFHCMSITYKDNINNETENILVGFINFWELDGFVYLEHLATKPECRNKGFGHLILDKLKEYTDLPLVLEVEKPTDSFSERRIKFYERNGLTYCNKDYLQPPYRQGDDMLPLNLMFYADKADASWQCENMGEHYGHVVKEIHTRVYGYFGQTKY